MGIPPVEDDKRKRHRQAHGIAAPNVAPPAPLTLGQGALQRVQRSPQYLAPSDVTTLQRTIGNRATAQLLGRAPASPAPVRRAPSRVIQRNFLDEQRRSWKEMPIESKALGMLLSPLNAIPLGLYGGYKGAKSAYKAVMHGGGKNPSRLRTAGALGAGLLGGIGGLVGGAIGGGLWGIANPLWSGAKRVGRGLGYLGGKAKEVPESIRQARGIYPGAVNHNMDTGTDLANYGMLGGSGVASATRFGLGMDLQFGKHQTSLVNEVEAGRSLTTNAQAIGGLGAGAGLLGVGSALVDAGRGLGQARDKSNRTSERRLGLLNMFQGLGSATQSASSSAANIAGLAGNAGAMAGATLAVGGAGIATGAMDLLRGGYGLYKGKQRRDALNQLAQPRSRQQEEAEEQRQEDAEEERIRRAALLAASTQQNRMDTGKANLVKGAAAVAGGALLLTSLTNPVGWGLLAGAAIIGGIAAFVKYMKRRKRKKEIAVRELGVEQERRDWKQKKKQVESDTWYGTDERARRMAQIGPDPLQVALQEAGYINVGHFYADYTTKTAQFLFDHGVQGDNPKAKAVVEGMGLKVNKDPDDPQKSRPSVAKIAKSLHD